jgi:putative transposase
MIIQKAFKYKFNPTPEQAKQLEIEFGCARFVWNHALNLRQAVFANCVGDNGKPMSMNYMDMNPHINFLKGTENFGWLKECSSAILTQKLIDLDKAYKNFFEVRAEFPKFKKKGHADAVRYTLDDRNLDKIYHAGYLLKVTGLGALDVVWSRLPPMPTSTDGFNKNGKPKTVWFGAPKMVTVSKTCTGKYFVSFVCEVEQLPRPTTGRIVGCDVGIKDVIVTSDGFSSGAPKFTYQYQRELIREQRKLSKKTKGSNRWKKQRIVVAKVHEKIANSRKDFLHKLTTKIVSENDVICLEDLNVSGMMQNRKLSKAVADVGLFELNRQIKYKAKWYGKEVINVGRFYPSTKTCSACGQKKVMKLSDRIYKCDCGLVLDRDFNAAINIKNEGVRLIAA